MRAPELQLQEKKTALERQQTDLDAKLLSIRSDLPSSLPLNVDNVGNVREACQARLATLPGERQPRHVGQPTAKNQLNIRQQLLANSGVVGFICDLVLVTDNEDARLLSFVAGSKLQTLVVTDYTVSVTVRDFLRGSGYKPRILPLDQANSLPELHVPCSGMFVMENVALNKHCILLAL